MDNHPTLTYDQVLIGTLSSEIDHEMRMLQHSYSTILDLYPEVVGAVNWELGDRSSTWCFDWAEIIAYCNKAAEDDEPSYCFLF